MTTDTTMVDWEAVEFVAARCGARTRALVADRDLEELQPWVLMLSHQNQGPAAATYFELAVLVGAACPLVTRTDDEEDFDDDWEPENDDLDEDEDEGS